jgi:hypothetical protein
MEIKDWDKNLDFKQVPLKINGKDFGKVHRGFKKQFQRTEKKMFENAQRYLNKGYKLEVAGHSQGGAAGTIASLYAKEKYGVKNVKVVTFGSPAAGNQDFAKKYNSKIKDNTRVVNSVELVPGTHSYDPVSHSTSIIPFMQYTHIGKEKKVSNGKGDIISYKGTHDMVNYERATRKKPVMDKYGPIIGFELDAAKKIGKFGRDVGKNIGKFGKDVGRNLGNFGKDVMKNLGKVFGREKKISRRRSGGRFGMLKRIRNNKLRASKNNRTRRNRQKSSKSRSKKNRKTKSRKNANKKRSTKSRARRNKRTKPRKNPKSKRASNKKSKRSKRARTTKRSRATKRRPRRSTGRKSGNRRVRSPKRSNPTRRTRSRPSPRRASAPRRAPVRRQVRSAPRRAPVRRQVRRSAPRRAPAPVRRAAPTRSAPARRSTPTRRA